MKKFEKERAIEMRRLGASIAEIGRELSVSKSSVSVWVRDVGMSDDMRALLMGKKTRGQKKAGEVLRARTLTRTREADCVAEALVNGLDLGSRSTRLAILASYYWCEGTKSPRDLVTFTNSDPRVIRAFVTLLRKCYTVDESKFHVMLHLHVYHNPDEELLYWSKVTSIPTSQFFRPYRKTNTATRKREGYRGCAQVRYYDVAVARELLALGRTLTDALGSIS